MAHHTVGTLALFVACILIQQAISKRYYTPDRAVGKICQIIKCCLYLVSLFTGKKLSEEYSKFDRRYPFEFGFGHYYQGDILLKPEESRVVIRDKSTRWPNAIVPYKIVANFSK